MKHTKLFIAVAVALTTIGCDYNARNFPTIDTTPTDVKTLEYTMTDDDYAAVSSNTANVAIAEAAGKRAQLTLVKNDKAFSIAIDAQTYAPAFLHGKWPTADEASAVKLTYKTTVNRPDYLSEIASGTLYTVTTTNYADVWGSTGTNYFTPVQSAATHLPAILLAALPTAEEGAIVHVNYNQAAAEPAPGIATTVEAKLYWFNGSVWAAYSAHPVYVVTKADFAEMGASYDNFSSSMAPENYIPRLLEKRYPFAQEDRTFAVVYKYYASSETSLRADQYTFDGTQWLQYSTTEVHTDQFVKTNGVWVYNPSVIINLLPIRNDAAIMAYYQAAVDWVWENVDVPNGATTKGEGYVTSYGNNDYYSGCSAYYNNVDMRPDKARSQYPAGYADMTDEQISALMTERLTEVMATALAKLHPDAKPVSGIDVTYTINLTVYTGVTYTVCTHQLVYKVVGQGEFEYVEDSFRPLF